MKKLAATLACAAALAVPGVASAYTGNTSSDFYSFDLGVKSDISIGVDWADLTYFFGVKNGDLSWTLAGPSSSSGTVTNGSGILGSDTISVAGLNAGHYTLTFNGSWAGGSGTKFTNGVVNLRDGDGGPLDPTNTFVATPVAAVPEPETYAMLLAGLGMMFTIGRRRRSNHHH